MRLLAHMLRRFVREGRLEVVDAEGQLHAFGSGQGPAVRIRLHDPALYRTLFTNPKLAVGEAYMDATLTFEQGELSDFLELFARNQQAVRAYPLQGVLRGIGRATRPLQQLNPRRRAQDNVAHHYDLSAELYRLFLDDDLQYSCAYFERPDATLEEAQHAKCRHIAAKLDLVDGQRVLDIGSGWGGLALDLARRHDVQVLGITLSREQLQVATERAKAEGLDDRVRFELRDYRDVSGSFDRIVSVGMFEHVGVRYYRPFFARVRELLTPQGVALLHSIGHRTPPGAASAWLRKYIFPGAYGPSLSETFAAIEHEDLWVGDCEILRLHYAETLRHWHRRFQANRERVAAIYDERFCRMWEFYLQSAEMMFRSGGEMVFQLLLARERDAVPITRDYAFAAEQAYREQDRARTD